MGLRVVGLFAGIGGIELGLHASGHSAEMLCEIDPGARAVLSARFPNVELRSDVRDLPASLPKVDLVTAGFPCQDLSQAGRTAGIDGRQSGLIHEVFKRINGRTAPTWLLLENVPFMLQLERGRAMRFLTDALVERRFMWAYRVVDTRAFGLPQRRKRVVLLASRTEDPRAVLFHGSEPHREPTERDGKACGFYWTEGSRGLGWAVDAVPTLKGGSTVGIPSPPGVWMPDGRIVTPSIRDAERLQGFRDDWTSVEVGGKPLRRGHRWKLVGNAVSVPMARWVGQRFNKPIAYDGTSDDLLKDNEAWPAAAWGSRGKVHRVDLSTWPVQDPYRSLSSFMDEPLDLLSRRASEGFLRRASRSSLNFHGLREAVEQHMQRSYEATT